MFSWRPKRWMHGGKGSYDRPRPRAQSSKLIPLVSTVAVLAGLVLIAGPTAAETDSDGDGFTDAAEAFLGTDALSACNATATANDEDTDAWPPDFNDDTKIDIADVVLLRSVYSSESGDGIYDQRFDLTADGKIDIAEVVRLRGVYGSSCESPPPPPPPPSGTFLETFDGEPSSPAAGSFYNNPDWDVSIQSRFDKETVEEMLAQMGPNCEPPPGTHVNDSYLGVVYICRNHLMTAIKASGYGVVYITPNHMVDFSQGEAVIRFEKSTLWTSVRDWWDMWITPFEDNLQHPLQKWLAFLAGEPRNAIHLESRDFNVIRDFETENLPSGWKTITNVLNANGLEPSPARRETFEVRISRDHVSLCLPAYDYCFLNKPIDPPLTWDKGIVQFGHHSYIPTKDSKPPGHDCSLAGLDCSGGPQANTWHWDNLFINPAVPFTIIHSDRRTVDGNANGANLATTVNFEVPAPANAFVRFHTMRDLGMTEISFDGGATWVKAEMQPSSKQELGSANCNNPCISNYWHPILDGTSSIQIRAGMGNSSGWFAQDIRIWAETVATSP